MVRIQVNYYIWSTGREIDCQKMLRGQRCRLFLRLSRGKSADSSSIPLCTSMIFNLYSIFLLFQPSVFIGSEMGLVHIRHTKEWFFEQVTITNILVKLDWTNGVKLKKYSWGCNVALKGAGSYYTGAGNMELWMNRETWKI